MRLLFKKYWLFLFLIVVIAYSQLLRMSVWQDDNALFFKLAHIQEPAGYLGKGLFGEYIYKYIAFYYYPIYLLFGFNTVPYFLYALLLYFLATFVIYKTGKYILGEIGGRVASFLFACGYIACDGFIRLYNSVPTSISIIFASLLFYFYWKYYKAKRISFYLLAILFYLLSVEFVMSRTAYLIFVPILFEFMFLFSIKNIHHLILRILPFAYLFYKYFLSPPDARSGGLFALARDLISGNLEKLSGFIGSISNVFIPDWVTNGKYYPFAIIALIIVILLFLTRKRLVWFLTFWILVNIFSYSAYNPTLIHASDHRYLAHSFLAIVFLLGYLFVNYRNKILRFLIILWGIGNLVAGINYQRNVLKSRSFPVVSFYNQLRQIVPVVKKGDVFYFDPADGDRTQFDNAFSVAQMPEETAIAWRYGIDRYDIKMCSNYLCYEKAVASSEWKGNFYTFFYKGGRLIDTRDLFDTVKKTEDYRVSINMVAEPQISYQESGTFWKSAEMVIDLKEPFSSVKPLIVSMKLSGKVNDFSADNFPLLSSNYLDLIGRTGGNKVDERVAREYKIAQDNFRKFAKVTARSEWQDRVVGNLTDGDKETMWQGDRLLWLKGPETVTIELPYKEKVNKLGWFGGYPESTPVQFFLETSTDGKTWTFVKRYSNLIKVNKGSPQEFDFPEVETKFLKITFEKTLNNDSPIINELWIVPTSVNGIGVNDAERFIEWPFLEVSDNKTYREIWKAINGIGEVKVYWMGDKSESWQAASNVKINLVYDGVMRDYKFVLPAGGTRIYKLKLVGVQIPGQIRSYEY